MTATREQQPRIVRLSGALAEVEPMTAAALYEVVRIGHRNLPGEVIRVEGSRASVQVFEETNGLAVGEPVLRTGAVLAVSLGPGLLGAVLDGVGRPLLTLAAKSGDFLAPGADLPTLDPERRWDFEAAVEAGAQVSGGDVLGTVQERGLTHRVLVPPATAGIVSAIRRGSYTVDEPIGQLEDGSSLCLAHRWSLRRPRPVLTRLPAARPLITGQRIFDLLFPVAEGGSVALPGGFGTGKTVIEQSLAKFAQADVIVYVACGERGNEMAEVLAEFPELQDPETGRSVMDRTVLVINTSNMPVAARDASVYLGFTIAEYYRDMGYRVAVMADSLSRWAEAHREIGARLGEMPGEEGYPTYLGNRIGQIYERSGQVEAAGAPTRVGSVTFISAISPPGGDFSEPVTQASLRVAGGLWALDPRLAEQRQFPAVDWESSYSRYLGNTADWLAEHGGENWSRLRLETLELLGRDRELRDVAGLIGAEAMEARDRLALELARVLREVVIGQSAFDPNDRYSPLDKTYRLAELTHELYRTALAALDDGIELEDLDLEAAARALAALRSAPGEERERRDQAATTAIAGLLKKRGAI